MTLIRLASERCKTAYEYAQGISKEARSVAEEECISAIEHLQKAIEVIRKEQ